MKLIPICCAILLLAVNYPLTANAKESILERAESDAKSGNYESAEHSLALWLEKNENDETARFLYARVLSWQSKFPLAIAQYERLVLHSPSDTDYLVGLSNTYIWAGQPLSAVSIIERIAVLDNGVRLYCDLRARIGAALSVRANGSSPMNIALELPRDSRCDAPKKQENNIAGKVNLNTSYYWLSGKYQPWVSAGISYETSTQAHQNIHLEVANESRYGYQDYHIKTSLRGDISEISSVTFSSDISPTANVLPQLALSVATNTKLTKILFGNLNLKSTRYRTTDSNQIAVGADLYVSHIYANYTLVSTNVSEVGWGNSQSVAVQWFISDKNKIGLIVAQGQESEKISRTKILTSNVSSYAIVGDNRLTKRWSFQYALEFSQQGDLYQRRGINAGIGYLL